MKAKPGEITAYTGNGYELIYWGEEKATPVDAIGLWQQVDASSDMILSRGKWKGYQWRALGVGIKDGYAILWFGDKIDNAPFNASIANSTVAEKPAAKTVAVTKPPVKEKTAVKSEPAVKPKEAAVIPEPVKETSVASGTTYYLIASSLKTVDAANTELKTIRAKGYLGAVIIESGVLFRIALASYNNEKDARARLSELKTTFPGIWLFKK
jgi:hypothetical protein